MSEPSSVDAASAAAASILSPAAMRSHALACQLMGVDFLPLSATLLTKPRGVKAASASAFAAPQSRETQASTPVVVPRTAASAAGSTRPAASASETFLPRTAPKPAPQQTPTQPSLIEVKPEDEPAAGAPQTSLAPLKKLDRDQAAAWLVRLRERYEHDAPHQQFVTDHHTIVFGEG